MPHMTYMNTRMGVSRCPWCIKITSCSFRFGSSRYHKFIVICVLLWLSKRSDTVFCELIRKVEVENNVKNKKL